MAKRKNAWRRASGRTLAHAEFALRGDDEDSDAEVAEGVTAEKEWMWIWLGGGRLAYLAEFDEGVGEGDDCEHLEEEDAEVDHVVGAEFGEARCVEEGVAEGQEGRVERVPVAVNDGVPVVGTDEVAEIHVGHGVTVDLVSVVVGVAEGDERGEKTVERPETTQPVEVTSGLRRGDGHEAGSSSEVFLSSSQMRRSSRTKRCGGRGKSFALRRSHG